MTIAEASERYGLSADTLRYYERIGLIPEVNRTAGGRRDYDESACRWVEFAKCMRSAGVEIEALIAYVALFQQGESTAGARRKLLVEQRDRLVAKMEAMQRTLERLDHKISNYDTIFAAAALKPLP